MPKQTLTHTCPVAGQTTLIARWLDDAKQLRAECDRCNAAVYANRSGQEQNTVKVVA